MRIDVYHSDNIPLDVYGSVVRLLHESFEERRAQGIFLKCGAYTPEELQHELKSGGYLLLAFDDKQELIGTVSLIERRKGRYKYVSHDNLAISNQHKGKGIAAKLFNEVLSIAKREEYNAIVSFTAVNAVSSVRYHLKRGFVIYSKAYGKDYNSYCFIYPLKRFRFMRNKVVSKIIYEFFKIRNKINSSFL